MYLQDDVMLVCLDSIKSVLSQYKTKNRNTDENHTLTQLEYYTTVNKQIPWLPKKSVKTFRTCISKFPKQKFTLIRDCCIIKIHKIIRNF